MLNWLFLTVMSITYKKKLPQLTTESLSFQFKPTFMKIFTHNISVIFTHNISVVFNENYKILTVFESIFPFFISSRGQSHFLSLRFMLMLHLHYLRLFKC